MSGARVEGVLSLSFDNLGEAAEIGAGARDPLLPPGGHPTATIAVPAILAELAARRLRASFFVEGLNAEIYPDLLRRIDSEGHEVAYHAWTHEQWGELSATEQRANLARGIEAFGQIGLAPRGMRPPGGALGPGGVEVLRDAGLRYGSPAGLGASVVGGIALLCFRWSLVDASCLLPELGSARMAMTGSKEPARPEDFLAHVVREVEQLETAGGYAAIVLHPFLLDWLGLERLRELLDRLSAARLNGLEVGRCDRAAEGLLGAK